MDFYETVKRVFFFASGGIIGLTHHRQYVSVSDRIVFWVTKKHYAYSSNAKSRRRSYARGGMHTSPRSSTRYTRPAFTGADIIADLAAFFLFITRTRRYTFQRLMRNKIILQYVVCRAEQSTCRYSRYYYRIPNLYGVSEVKTYPILARY